MLNAIMEAKLTGFIIICIASVIVTTVTFTWSNQEEHYHQQNYIFLE
jgi:uncharacterized membrane protein